MNNYPMRIVGTEHAQHPDSVLCDHGCTYVIQLVNPDTDFVEMEFCPLTAEQIAGWLLDAIELCHKSS